jgi:hypothetical protein
MRLPFPKPFPIHEQFSLPAWKEESILRGLFACLITLVCLNALATTVADPDLWGYLAFGRLFWETGRFPYEDIFAYVPTLKLWVYHEWLTGVLFYPIYQALGDAGLQVVKITLGLATVYLVYLTARRQGAHFWSALLGLWGTQFFLALGYSPVRAQVFTYFFFALSLFVLESARLSGRWRGLVVLVVIQLFWCNLHAGFLAGLGLIGLYGLGEAVSRRPFWPYLAALGAASLVTLINPYGLEYWAYLLRAVTMPRPEITEWASVYQAWQEGFPREPLIYFVSLAGFTVLLLCWDRWREITPDLVLGLTMYLGFKHLRHQVFFFLAAGAYLPMLLEAFGKKVLSSPGLASGRWRRAGLFPVILALAGIMVYGYKVLSKDPLTLTFPRTSDSGVKVSFHYPVAAVKFLQDKNFSGNILSGFTWGEYLIWSLHPACKVAMDGRYETVYGEDLCRLHEDFSFGRPGWRKILKKFPPDLILVDPQSKVYPLLQEAPDWRQAYKDSGAALFLPEEGPQSLSLSVTSGQ